VHSEHYHQITKTFFCTFRVLYPITSNLWHRTNFNTKGNSFLKKVSLYVFFPFWLLKLQEVTSCSNTNKFSFVFLTQKNSDSYLTTVPGTYKPIKRRWSFSLNFVFYKYTCKVCAFKNRDWCVCIKCSIVGLGLIAMFSAMLCGSSKLCTIFLLTLPVLTCFSNTFAMSAGLCNERWNVLVLLWF
jgi:hypothetical protein